MASLELPRDIVRLDTGKTFVPLGEPNLIFNPTHQLNEAVSFRVRGITEGRVNGFWGTLGRSDDKPLNWEGTVYCSGMGNTAPSGDVAQLAEAIRLSQPDDPAFRNTPIVERYVAFDDVQFPSDAPGRSLRLTVLLEANEAAIVFYHHGTPGDTSGEGVAEYILPAEGNAKSSMPGRKTFLFEVPQISDEHNDIDAENAAVASRFVVKVIVFQYPPQPEDYVAKRERYALLKYNHAEENGFELAVPGSIDFTKKTLLLLHGTVATSSVSFRGLHKNRDDGSSLLQHFLDEGYYEQIIAFDHKTLADDTFQNINQLKKFLDDIQNDWAFTQTLDVIATSRGGLVAKTLAGDRGLNKNDGRLRIDKIALVSCPNGAALLDPETGERGIRLILSALAKTSGSLAPVLIPLVQMGATKIFNLPGLKVQTPGAPELQAVLDLIPVHERTRYYPVCGQWKPDGLLRILDFLIDRILKAPNDWVNYTSRMNIMPAGKLAYRRTPDYFVDASRLANAVHTNYYYTHGETKPATYTKEFLIDQTENWM